MVSSMNPGSGKGTSDGIDKKVVKNNGEKTPVNRFPPLHPAALVPHFPSNPPSNSIHQLGSRRGSMKRNSGLSIPTSTKQGLSVPSTPRPGGSIPNTARSHVSQVSMTEVVAAAKRAKATKAAEAFTATRANRRVGPPPPTRETSSPVLADGPAIPDHNARFPGMFRRMVSAMQARITATASAEDINKRHNAVMFVMKTPIIGTGEDNRQ